MRWRWPRASSPGRSATACSRTWPTTGRSGSERRAMNADQATLRVRHRTRYVHDAPVELAHHLAHLRPRETARQRVTGWRLDVQPEPDAGAQALDASVDVFGNWRHCFSHARVHDRL